MRIAIVSRAMDAEFREHGESGWTGYQLARAVSRLGHDVRVLTQSPRVSHEERRLLGDLPAWVCPESRRIPYCWPADKLFKWFYGTRQAVSDALRLDRFIRSEGPFDVVWAMSEEPDAVVCAVASRLRLRVPYAVQIQALRYRIEAGAPTFIDQRTLGKGFARAALVVANSPMVGQLIVEKYGVPAQRIAWLPPNLTDHFLSSLEPDAVSSCATTSAGAVLFLGAINPKKGADIFLKAATEIVAARPATRFRMIGRITEPRSAFAAAWPGLVQASRLGSALHLLGHVPAAEVIREIRQASVVVLPSRIDEFSRAALECLALGVPVVTTSGVGAAYVVERDGSGLVVRPDDAVDLARAIEKVLSDDSFSISARRHAEPLRREFSAEALAAKWVRMLQDAIRDGKRPAGFRRHTPMKADRGGRA